MTVKKTSISYSINAYKFKKSIPFIEFYISFLSYQYHFPLATKQKSDCVYFIKEQKQHSSSFSCEVEVEVEYEKKSLGFNLNMHSSLNGTKRKQKKLEFISPRIY